MNCSGESEFNSWWEQFLSDFTYFAAELRIIGGAPECQSEFKEMKSQGSGETAHSQLLQFKLVSFKGNSSKHSRQE
jgi:hypothetical protein